MVKKITAISSYRPRIELGKAVSEERYMELLTQRTTLSAGVVRNVQECEVETLIGLLLDGCPVHTGVAIYTPTVDLEGNFAIKVKVDKRMPRAMNAEGAFRGHIRNAENIGQSVGELVERWNVEHPDDPVED